MAEYAPKRRTEGLRRGRASSPHARYFITICTAERKSGLLRLEPSDLFAAMEDLEQTGDLQNYCATIMPDHVHWLFQLGGRLTLGQIVARWKSATRKLLTTQGVEWQRDFFERRIREEERLEGYGLYIFLNPYRANLVSMEKTWPHWRIWQPALFEFSSKMGNGSLPQPEWLDKYSEPPWMKK